MKDKRILFAGGGGTREIHFFVAKGLREKGFNVDLVVNDDSWLLKREDCPEWVTGWNGGKIELLKKMRSYDLIQSYGTFSIYSMLSGKPYIAYATGSDLRELAREKTVKGFAMRNAFSRANKLFYSNLDLHDVCVELGLKNAVFVPQAIETDKYAPDKETKVVLEGEPSVFSPVHHDWQLKGNDVLIKEFADYAVKNPKARLYLVDWWEDARKSWLLSRKLAPGKVVFLPKIPKEELASYYLAADVVADQFALGSFAGVTLEAMACGKPVVTYYRDDLAKKLYDGKPLPIYPAKHELEVYHALDCLSKDYVRKMFSELGRTWVVEHHSIEKVLPQFIKAYDEVSDSG